jgi:endonuclease/exonuclease/phosphatase family metal-dependent hydrolase
VRIRLASYNIHRCIGADHRENPDRILTVLRDIDADVVALQEVVSHPGRETDFVVELTRATSSRVLIGTTLVREDSHYGNVLLTRLPVESVRRVDLSVPSHEPRGAIEATLRVGDLPLLVVATHLGLRPFERRLQVRQLLSTVFQQLTDPPSAARVLMGDLNEWFLWGRPLRWLTALFGNSPAPATFPSRWPCLALDRIWVQPQQYLRSLRVHRTPAARAASDHLPLVATLDVPKQL